MGFVPIERLTEKVENPYEAILVAAKEARIQNSISQLKDLDPNVDYPKITTLALERVIDGTVQYYYEEEEEEDEKPDAKKGKSKGNE